MRRLVPDRSTAALAISLLALVVGASGVASASNPAAGEAKLSSSTKKAIKKYAKSYAKHYMERGPRGHTGPTGATGATGGSGGSGPQGPAGTARAFGIFKGDGSAVDPSRQFGITGVTRPANRPGKYCLTLASNIDAHRTVVVASPDYSNSDRGSTAAQDSLNVDCSGNQVEVAMLGPDAQGAPTPKDEGFVVSVP